MKTTIDLPDELLHRAKIAAAERRTTLKELVMRGLDYVIEHPQNREEQAKHRQQKREKLLLLLDRVEINGPVGDLEREEIHDRDQGKWE